MDERVQFELNVLDEEVRARFERIVNMIESSGLLNLREPYVKHLEDKLWEMRAKGKDGIARAIYVTASGKRVVILLSLIHI